MNKKINWQNVSITLLIVSNLFLVNEITSLNNNGDLENENEQLRNELVILDEETADYYYLYKKTLNDLYMLEVESGYYNESNNDTMRNPMTGKLEKMLIDNHKNGNY